MDNVRTYFLEYLAAEGYRPVADEDGDVIFKAEGEKFVVRRDLDDLEYFRVTLAYNGIDGTELAFATRVANDLSREYKAVKITVEQADGSVCFAYEAFYGGPEDAAPFLQRVMRALVAASNEFFAGIREGQDAWDDDDE